MSELLVRPDAPAGDGTILTVTPESAGWQYIGLRGAPAAAGRRSATGTPALASVCVVIISGTVDRALATRRVERSGRPGDPGPGVRTPPTCHRDTVRDRSRHDARGRPVLGSGAERRRAAARAARRRDRGRDAGLRRAGADDPPDPDGRPRGRLAARGRGPDARRPLVELSAPQARPRRSPARDVARGDLLSPRLPRPGLRPAACLQPRPLARRDPGLRRSATACSCRAATTPFRRRPATTSTT